MRNFLESNLARLEKLDPDLAGRMRGLSVPEPSLTVFASRSGAPTVKARAFDGAEIRIHSEYDPAGEARQFLEARPLAGFDTYILSGFGLGYTALELAHQAEPRRWIACIESHEGLFRAALEAVDLGPLFDRENVCFFVGHDGVAFQNFLRSFLIRSGALAVNYTAYPPCVRLHPEFSSQVSAEVDAGIRRQKVELVTVINRGRDMDRNGIRNLAVMARSNTAAHFEGAFKGLPVIVCGAGPSLTPALPQLRAAQGRAVIVVADVALRLLVREGIEPDFVATLDMKEATSTFFQGFEIPEKTALVFDPDCYHGTSEGFRGPKLSYETAHGLQGWSKAFLGDLGLVDKGTSVAHTAYFFAAFTRADPILLVGVDLCYPSEHSHAEGVQDSVRQKIGEVARKWIMVPGVSGSPVRTVSNFATYITHFEGAISRTKARVIQTSEIGALIRGAEHMPLPAALEKFAARPAPIAERIRGCLDRPRGWNRTAFETLSTDLLASMARMQEACAEGGKLASQAARRDPANRTDQEDLSRLLRRMKGLQDEVIADKTALKIVDRLLSPMVCEVRTLDREIDDMAKDDPERFRKVVRQFELLFRSFSEAVEFFLSEFRPVRERMLLE